MTSNGRITALNAWPDDPDARWRRARQEAEFCLILGRILFPEVHDVIPRELAPLWNQTQRVLACGGDPHGNATN